MTDDRQSGAGGTPPAPDLPPTTLCYLFGPKWATPSNGGPFDDIVPGQVVDGLDTAANLLCVGLWSLWRGGWITLDQLGPVRSADVMVLGGASFVRVTALTDALTRAWTPAGLEGALWTAVLRQREDEGRIPRMIRRASGEDRYGLRTTLLGLRFPKQSWKLPLHRCRNDAIGRGLLELQGRWWNKRLNVPDMAAAKAQLPAYQRVAEARQAFRTEHADLDRAMLADCRATLDWARTRAD